MPFSATPHPTAHTQPDLRSRLPEKIKVAAAGDNEQKNHTASKFKAHSQQAAEIEATEVRRNRCDEAPGAEVDDAANGGD